MGLLYTFGMSWIHAFAIIFIGFFVGCLYDMFSIRKYPIGLWPLVLTGIFGAFIFDLFDRLLVLDGVLPTVFYKSKILILLIDTLGSLSLTYVIFRPLKRDTIK